MACGILLAPAAPAATIHVDSVADDGGAGCQLREAIASLNAGVDLGGCGNVSKSSYGDGDTIDATGVHGTIQLVGGTLVTTVPMLLEGPGAGGLTIRGKIHAVNGFRVFWSQADLTVEDVTISGGNATSSMVNGGGGILATAGNLTLQDTVVSGNSTAEKDGGGIEFLSTGDLAIVRSTIGNNAAPGPVGDGGGVFVNSGSTTSVVVDSSTIYGNEAGNVGGGILVIGLSAANRPTWQIVNSTISGNSSVAAGGGVYAHDALLTVRNSTIAFNSGPAFRAHPTATVENTIIAQGAGGGAACLLAITSTFPTTNLFSDTTCNGTATTLHAIGLMPLSEYGGPTKTHALTNTSAAIDQGADGICDAIGNLDQRGIVRPIDGDVDFDDLCDIGALEYEVGGYTCDVGEFDVASFAIKAAEDGGPRKVTVLRSGGTCGPVSVDYATTGDTATSGVDFEATSGTLEFDDGESSKSFFVRMLDDALDEPRETFLVDLSDPVGTNILTTTTIVTITDDDATPVLSITGDASAAEGSEAHFTLNLSNPSSRNIAVRVVASGTATRNTDYVFSDVSLVIPAGDTSVTRDLRPGRLDVKTDGVADPGETIVLTITATRYAIISGVANAHTIVITE